jgi:hypothetical protein
MDNKHNSSIAEKLASSFEWQRCGWGEAKQWKTVV